MYLYDNVLGKHGVKGAMGMGTSGQGFCAESERFLVFVIPEV